jgi:Fe-S-cluster containining protein
LRVNNLPHSARLVLDRYVSDMWRRTSDDYPCCWLDLETKRCRWYEWRPQICRDLDPGSEGCRVWRDEYNVDVEALNG